MTKLDPIPVDVAKPLLALSRHSFSELDCDRLRGWCEDVSDWRLLIDTAARKFSLPFVYRNLSRIYANGGGPSEIALMRSSAKSLQISALGIAAVQSNFHQACIEPLDIRHAYLKGLGLEATFYDFSGLRYSRDIDILLDPKDMPAVVRLALSQGYKLIGTSDVADVLGHPKDRRALLRYSPVAILMSPQGIPIELHKEIDKNLGLFDTDRLLDTQSTFLLGGVEMHMLPTEETFCFVCYHNTRHLWSRLHWLADLSAILESDKFNLKRTLSLADKLGMRGTVDAAIEMDHLVKSGKIEPSAARGHGGELVQMCVQNLSGDLELERELRAKMPNKSLPFDWLLSAKSERKARIRRFKKRFEPSFEQYSSWPLPDKLQWIYYLTKPLFSIWKRARGAVN